jgi:hypothetical protein
MRVHIYLREDGLMDVLVESSPGRRRSPVLVQGVTQENVVDKVGPVVAQVRGPRETQPVPPSP